MQSPFTDNNIQNYLDGVYAGNTKALEDYLQNTEEGRQRLANYSAMFRMLRNGPLPSLNRSLDEAVLSALDARQRKPASVWTVLLWIVTALCIAGTLIFGFVLISELSFFKQSENSLLMPFAVLLLVLLLVGFHGIDWYRQYRRYARMMM